MSDRLEEDARLVEALRVTGSPPKSWLDAAVEIPVTLGDLTSIEQLVASDAFRARFTESPESAVAEAGLPATAALVAALRAELA
jgi:hypothetical protein